MTLKKGDFIEIEFIGKIKENGIVFDVTNEQDAKKYNLYNSNIKYSPVIICIGENNIVKSLDEFLIGKEIKEYTIELSSEKAFGKKDPKLMKIVSSNIFKKQKITPFPGLQINFDGVIGTIVTAGSGRVIVDFNHPLAGKDLIYEIKIKRLVTDTKEKLFSILKPLSNKEIDIKIENSIANVELKINEQFQKPLIDKIKILIPEIKDVKFIQKNN
ncbi:MAG: peptidylprolyl isomerase [Candidatus Woesearchaeota archaeon]